MNNLSQMINYTTKLGLISLMWFLTACGNSKFTAVEYQCKVVDNMIVCPDGSTLELPAPVAGPPGAPGQDGTDGTDGQDGQDGEDAVLLTQAKVEANTCTKVADGLYVESIRNSQIFDVYSNDKCKDSLGEYCDNVEPSFGSSGSLGENKPGGAEVCWAGNRMVTGEKVGNDLLIRVLDFNQEFGNTLDKTFTT